MELVCVMLTSDILAKSYQVFLLLRVKLKRKER